MGLGAYLAATTERRHYQVELARERRQVTTCADQEEEIMVGMFADYGIGVDDIRPLTWKLRNNLEGWAQVWEPRPMPSTLPQITHRLSSS